MSGHLSQGLKERVVRSVMDEGLSQADTARQFTTAEATVSRTMTAYRERGTVPPKELKPGPASKLEPEHLDWLRARMEEALFLSTYELTPMFNEALPSCGRFIDFACP